MRFGSLFSGIGGFDLGFEQAGLGCEWQVEIDKDCTKVLENRFPNVSRFTDVKDVGKLPTVDVICGGFPCQDLSVAGKRKGLAGERSGLWFEFLRIIESNLPRWICIENVPGLLSSDEGRDFAAILRGLVNVGYCLAWRVADAQHFGVAQRRRRVFIVGSLGDGSCAEILFEREGVSWNPPTRGEAGARVTPILEAGARTNGDGNRDGDGIGVEGDPMFTLQRGKQHAVSAAVSAKWAKGTGGPAGDEAYNLVTHALRSEGADASEDGTGRGTPLVVDRLEHHRFHCLACGQWFGVNDYESNTVTCPKCGETHINKITDVLDDPEIAATLNSGGNNGGFRSEPGEHLVATAYRTAGNCGPFEQGDKTAALNTATDPNQNIIAFSSKDHGADAGEISPTLRAQNFKDSHMNGGGQVAIAFDERNITSKENRSNPRPGDPCHTLHADPPTLAFTERTRLEGRTFEAQEELAYAVTNPGSGGRTHSRQIAGNFGVRRLTPRECERLQGFPDDWTLYDAAGKEISDSARYRMLGNAVAVPVARWVGKQLLRVIG